MCFIKRKIQTEGFTADNEDTSNFSFSPMTPPPPLPTAEVPPSSRLNAAVVELVFFACSPRPTNLDSCSSGSKLSSGDVVVECDEENDGSLRTGELGSDMALSNASSMERKLAVPDAPDTAEAGSFGLDLGRRVSLRCVAERTIAVAELFVPTENSHSDLGSSKTKI